MPEHEPWPYQRFPQSITGIRLGAPEGATVERGPVARLLGAAASNEELRAALAESGVRFADAQLLPTTADLVVVDASGGGSVEELTRSVRATAGVGDVPMLVVVPAAWVERSVGAPDVDVVPLPLQVRVLRRRVAILAELSRARRALTLRDHALEASVNGITIADARVPGHPLVYASPAFERMTGYTSEELLGRNCRILQGPRTEAHTVERIGRALRNAESVRAIIQNYRKDGTAFTNELTIVPLRDADGSVAYFIGVQHDVSELIAARAELVNLRIAADERRSFVEAILDGIQSAIVTTDADDRVTFINRAACELLEVGAAACVGKGAVAIMRMPAAAHRPMVQSRVARFTYAARRADGTELAIGVSVSRAEDGGSPHKGGCFYIFRDLSDSRQTELESRRVDHLAALGTMMAGFAHEVRNPLAGVRLLVEGMHVEMEPTDPRVEYLDRSLRQLDRIERLVKTALQFGRPEPPQRRPCSAGTLVSQAVEAVQPRIRQLGGGSIRVDLASRAGLLLVDDTQTVQVLVILLTNALEATGSAASVRVHVEDEAESCRRSPEGTKPAVRIAIIDEGPGIPEHIVSRIFDPFFTTKATGTGLGLSIAQQLVSENGGRLEVTSSPGQTTFSIILPTLGEE